MMEVIVWGQLTGLGQLISTFPECRQDRRDLGFHD